MCNAYELLFKKKEKKNYFIIVKKSTNIVQLDLNLEVLVNKFSNKKLVTCKRYRKTFGIIFLSKPTQSSKSYFFCNGKYQVLSTTLILTRFTFYLLIILIYDTLQLIGLGIRIPKYPRACTIKKYSCQNRTNQQAQYAQ